MRPHSLRAWQQHGGALFIFLKDKDKHTNVDLLVLQISMNNLFSILAGDVGETGTKSLL